MNIRVLSFWCISFLMAGIFCMPIVCAVDQDAFHDAKFDFKFEKEGVNGYKTTLTRKDNDFIDHNVLFIYNLVATPNPANANKPVTMYCYIFLEAGQKTVTSTGKIDGKIHNLKPLSYGIKFSPTREHRKNVDIMDTGFNLNLKYYDPWFNHKICKPNIGYRFYRRDGKVMDCDVLLKRKVDLIRNGQLVTEWPTFTISKGTSRTEGVIYDDKSDLMGFQSSPEEYYFQFIKT